MTGFQYLRYLGQRQQDNQQDLFSPRENYLASCDEKGIPWAYYGMSPKDKALIRANNLHLLQGLECSIPNHFPRLKAYNGDTNCEFVAFNERNRPCNKQKAVHFFTYDFLFDSALWKHPETITFELVQRPCVIAPGYSLYVDAPVCPSLKIGPMTIRQEFLTLSSL